ncbi:hypothetical protein BGW80DRAFT_1247775 [Lactifluus volemus]|nr:hypothetical protein BGW80DRAFT_1247775 [Lactifluus volemus]
MAEIEIFLIYNGAPKSFLLIPHSDIQRLAIYPFRWLRYVVFAISGARGDLSTTLEGPYVDYDRTEIADAEIRCYYWPSENWAFVDREGLNNRLMATNQTLCCPDFRNDVMRRDGPSCVVTQLAEEGCDAVHLIPQSKGNEYIKGVIKCRSPGDNSAPPRGVGIDDVRNGMMLQKTLHLMLGKGAVAFMKTPNYGLDPKHINRFQRGSPRPDYITLQFLKEHKGYNPTSIGRIDQGLLDAYPGIAFSLGANGRKLATINGHPDYVYGVAAYKTWRSKRDGDFEPMTRYCKEHYTDITPLCTDE